MNCNLVLWDVSTEITEIAYGEAGDHDAGTGYMGPNKDGNEISYTSPCSSGSGTFYYTLTMYALSDIPDSLPTESSTAVTYEVLMDAIDDVIISETTLEFTSTQD